MRITAFFVSLAYAPIHVHCARDAHDVEVQFLPIPGHQDHHHDAHHDHGHPPRHNGHGAVPLGQFMKMFPMDLPAGAHVKVIHLGPGMAMGGDSIDDLIGDQIINSILSELSPGFHTNTKPLLTHVHAASRSNVPHPCIADLGKLCHEGHGHNHKHESSLHCLGLHAEEISTECAKEVQQSLPFICSIEISLFCSSHSTIEKSVLQCLEEQSDAGQHIDGECKDSITATRAIVTRMKTQHMSLIDKRTGNVIRTAEGLFATTVYAGAYLAVLVVLAIVLYAFWVRDDETGFVKSIQRTIRELRLMGGKRRLPGKVSTMEMKGSNGYSRQI